jgi:hypothetical protein
VSLFGSRPQSLSPTHLRLDGAVVAMPMSDLVIHRFAHLFIQLHAEKATAKAREMVEEMRCKGDRDGADTWLHIIEAMGELGGAINLAPDGCAPSEARIEQRLRRVYYGRLARARIDAE